MLHNRGLSSTSMAQFKKLGLEKIEARFQICFQLERSSSAGVARGAATFGRNHRRRRVAQKRWRRDFSSTLHFSDRTLAHNHWRTLQNTICLAFLSADALLIQLLLPRSISSKGLIRLNFSHGRLFSRWEPHFLSSFQHWCPTGTGPIVNLQPWWPFIN